MCKLWDEIKAEGHAESKQEDIIEILEDYGDVSESLKSVIMGQKDIQTLKNWLKKAAKAKSVEEFEKEIELQITS